MVWTLAGGAHAEIFLTGSEEFGSKSPSQGFFPLAFARLATFRFLACDSGAGLASDSDAITVELSDASGLTRRAGGFRFLVTGAMRNKNKGGGREVQTM